MNVFVDPPAHDQRLDTYAVHIHLHRRLITLLIIFGVDAENGGRGGVEGLPCAGMSTTSPPRFQWSELARRSGEVGDAIDTFGEVTVIRGSQTLRLGLQSPAEASGVLHDMCRLLAALTSEDEATHVTRILSAAWPWTRALPGASQLELANEVGPVAEMCESLGSYKALTDLLADWRRTARAWADSETGPIHVDEPLASPASRPKA